MTMTIRPIETGEDAKCGALLRAFPEWFGIEEDIADYARGLASLVEHAERALRAQSVEVLRVKTLSPSRPDAHDERTRGFYEHMGPVRFARRESGGTPTHVL